MGATGRTIGHLCTGTRIIRRDGTRPTLGQVLGRQTLFVLWTGLNVFFLLPWLVVSPLLIAFTPSRRNFFDIWA